MRILTIRCRRFEYEVTSASSAAVPLEPHQIRTEHTFDACLFLMVGVEHGDLEVIKSAAKMVRRVANKTMARHVAINGFSHLADPEARPGADTAGSTLRQLAECLSEHIDVHLMPFGWNKRWSADVLDGEWEQRVLYVPTRADTAPLVLG